ncbi:hypothetical protein OXX59_009352 [Metschnikowia pulcherrima]
MMYFIAVLMLAARFVSADEGCFSSVDTSVSKGPQQYGTQSSCSESCGSSYPYVAMKNGGDCYCLSKLPSSSLETSSSQCSVGCNGYGQTVCGGTNAYTVFENIEYSGGAVSSGAASSSSSSAASRSSSLSSRSASASSAASSSSAGESSVTDGATQSASSSIVTSDPSSSSSSVSMRTVTATSGSTSSPTSSSGSNSNNSENKSKTNVAPIVGGVVGGVAALAIGLAILFFIRRRNSKDDDDEEDFYKKGSAGSAGSGGVARAKSNKFNSVFDMPMANPFEHPSDVVSEKRASSAAAGELTDPRLNPVMMGRRRLSEGSLADEADYSRKILSVANP